MRGCSTWNWGFDRRVGLERRLKRRELGIGNRGFMVDDGGQVKVVVCCLALINPATSSFWERAQPKQEGAMRT